MLDLKKINQQAHQPHQQRSIVIIDGMNNFIRYYMANQSITSSGVPVGGVVGFIKFIQWITNDLAPSKVYCVWEQGGGSARRKKIYEGYKSGRTKSSNAQDTLKSNTDSDRKWIINTANNKAEQLQLLIAALKHTPVNQLYLQDIEADDVIAYLAKYHFKSLNCKKVIVSADKDMYQLLEDPMVEIYDPLKKIIINGDKVKAEYGIAPCNFVLARAIVGDESDDVKGIDGVGLKTVAKRFPELLNTEKDYYSSDIIDMCKKHIDAGSKIKIYQSIFDNKDIIDRNWKLMYLDTNCISANQIAKLEYAINNFQPRIDKLGMIKSLLSNGINSDIDFDRFSHVMRSYLV